MRHARRPRDCAESTARLVHAPREVPFIRGCMRGRSSDNAREPSARSIRTRSRLDKRESRADMVTLFPVGAFGDAVARWLRTFSEVEVTRRWPEAIDGPADVVLAVLDGPRFPLCAEIERRCWQHGKSSLFVVPLGNLIQIGPMSVPGEPGCWHCAYVRRRQHSGVPTWVQNAQHEYELNVDAGCDKEHASPSPQWWPDSLVFPSSHPPTIAITPGRCRNSTLSREMGYGPRGWCSRLRTLRKWALSLCSHRFDSPE